METVPDDPSVSNGCSAPNTSTPIVDDVTAFATDDELTDSDVAVTLFADPLLHCSDLFSSLPRVSSKRHQHNGPKSKLHIRLLKRRRQARKKKKPRLRLIYDEFVGSNHHPFCYVGHEDPFDTNTIDVGILHPSSSPIQSTSMLLTSKILLIRQDLTYLVHWILLII